jgi:pSer/pThr/pTyr-binding forkhead associated (FHA) protein
MPYESTRLETDEEVRQALRRYRPESPQIPAPPALAPLPVAPADDGPPLYRPTCRPPMPLLTVLDDGVEEGEAIRIRQEQFVIGRTEGDLMIAHDVQMSSRHAQLQRKLHKDKRRWVLTDLGSTNGTYVRVGHALLEHGQEFILGRTRLRFENKSDEAAAPDMPTDQVAQTTRPWPSGLERHLAPAIVELLGERTGSRVIVSGREAWLGKDAVHCRIVLRDDPFASARHARIRLDDEGRWLIENNKSLNGVWLRVDRIVLKGTCYFLLGEQQFIVRVPSWQGSTS